MNEYPTGAAGNIGSALPALAVADNGTVGLLYTAFVPNAAGGGGSLQTHFVQAAANFTGGILSDTILTVFPDGTPARISQPYIGDYEGLTSVGGTFYGTFSASNDPRSADFPQGVIFQRFIRDVTTNQVLNADSPFVLITPSATDTFRLAANAAGAAVAGPNNGISIDPYFFSVPAAAPEPSTLCLAGIGGGLLGLWALRRRRQSFDRMTPLAA